MLRRLELSEFPEDLANALAPRIARLGYLGEFFSCAAHQPGALLAFIEFTERSKEQLPFELTETIALTCAAWMENAYECHQHERLCLKTGKTTDWIKSVQSLDPDQVPAVLSESERLIQRLALTILKTNGHAAGEVFEEARASLGDAGAIGALMILGRYVVHALIVNTLALTPPVASVFEEGLDA